MIAVIDPEKQSPFDRGFDSGIEIEDSLTSRSSLDFSMPSVQPACAADVGSLIRLSGAHVPQVAATTVWEIPWSWNSYRVVRDSTDQIVGAGALIPISHSLAEIRGLVVSSEWRGTGIATMVVNHLLNWADELKMDAVCVTRKPSFFRKLGFQETNPAWLDAQRTPMQLPVQISRSPNYSKSLQLPPRVAMALAS